jgi:VCBS repeat-containing protein
MATGSAVGDGPSVAPVKLSHDGGGSVPVADAKTLFLGDYSREGHDLLIEHGGNTVVVEGYFAGPGANLVGPTGAFLTPAVVEALAGPAAPGQYAQAGTEPAGNASAATSLTEIGKVVQVSGVATATHADGVTVNLANGDPVYQGDVVRTGPDSKLGISFIDDSVFSLSADASMVLDELVFDPAKLADSSMVVNLVQGSFVFVTGQVAPTGNMKVETPVATMGIRGTTPKVLINTDLGVTEFTILPDPDSGKIGSYLLIDKATGEILGTVESVGDKWVITSLSDEAVKVAKSGLDLLEDERALADIRDAVSNALGKRAEYDGTNAFQQVAFDSSASAGGQGEGQGGNGEGGGPGGGNGVVVDPTPDKDDPPIAGDDAFGTHEDSLLGGNVINSSGGGPDVDPDGFALTVSSVNGATVAFGAGGWSGFLDLPLSADAAAIEHLTDGLDGAIVQFNTNGTFVYDPRSAFNWLAVGETGTDTFTYTIRDQFGYTDTATVTVTIEGRNDAPVITVANPEDVIGTINDIAEDDPSQEPPDALAASGTITFADVDLSDRALARIGNDRDDPDNPSDPYDVSVTATAQGGGALVLTAAQVETIISAFKLVHGDAVGDNSNNGSVDWVFAIDENDIDFLGAEEIVTAVFTIIVDDGHPGGVDTQTVTITINGANAAENGPNDRPVISVVAGDADLAGLDETNAALTTSGTLTVTEVDLTDEVDLDVVSVVPGGSGPTDGRPSPEALKAMLTVTSEPVLDDTATTTQKFTWSFDSNGETFDYLAEDETLVLTYTISATDDENASDTQTVTITIAGTNDAPTMTAEVAAAVEDGPTVDVDLSALGDDVDSDDDGTTLTYSIVSQPSAGSASIDLLDGTTLTFDPGSDFQDLAQGETRQVIVQVQATDTHGAVSNTADIVVTITGTNDAPTMTAGVVAAAEDGPTVDVDLTTLGDDVDSDDDGTTLTYSIVGQPSAGSASIDLLDGTTLTFDPGSDFQDLAQGETRQVIVQVQATDAHGAVSNTADIVVTITGTNDAPTMTAGVAAAAEDGPTVDVDLTTLGDDVDSDDDGTSLEYTITPTGQPSEGTASILGTTLTFNPGSDFQDLTEGETRQVTIYVQAQDAHGAVSNTTAIVVTVTGTNDAPMMTAGVAAAAEDGPTVDVDLTTLGDDVDSDDNGTTLTYSLVGSPSAGSASIDPLDGTTLTFDPGSDFQDLAEGETRQVIVQVQATDAHGTVSNTADIVVTITGTNDAPTMTAGVAAAAEDGPTVDVELSALGDDVDSDDDGTTLTYSLVGSPSDGSVSIDDTTLTFDPGSDFQDLADGETRLVTLQVQATDAHGAVSNITDVVVAVTGDNDAPELVAGGTLDYTHGARQIDGALTVMDVDSSTLVGATVSIGAGFVAGEDMLGFVDQNGIVADYDEVNGVLLLQGVATVAQYQAALRSVIYRNDAADPTLGAREISFVVDDGDEVSAPATSTVTVSTLNEIVGTELQDIELTDTELAGTAFADRILGLGGGDQLFGGDGNDVLVGGQGSDELTGDLGADEFVFLADETEADTILDFDSAEDFINLADYLEGNLSSDYITLEQSGDDAILSVDRNLGVGSPDFVHVATFQDFDAGDPVNIIFDDAEASFQFQNAVGV